MSGIRVAPPPRSRQAVRTARRATDHSHAATGGALPLALGALGVVYGDIGTSPLYALRETFHSGHGLALTEANMLGVLSTILWSLVVVISVKYIGLVMRADNRGEGGILALLALIGPTTAKGGRRLLVILGLFGTGLLFGDGVITPAISVLSAVEGFEVFAPSFGPFVVPVAVAIIIALFAVQRWGTGAVGLVFGPIMLLWFAVIAALGVAAIVQEPAVLRAVSPAYTAALFFNEPFAAFIALGAVFLVVTGGEALYADMGHFGRRPMAFGWFIVVLPALTLSYLGQGAALLADPSAVESPFYHLAPAWSGYGLAILATAATVIASQALISGAFSLAMQAVQLDYLPRLRIEHTSPDHYGQVYVPAVNIVLLVGCVGTVVVFGSSANLAGAYGVAVTATMAITTILLYSIMRDRWHWRRAVALPVIGALLVVDIAFLGANVLKILDGGWFPLAIGLGVFAPMVIWRAGRARIARARREQGIERTALAARIRRQAETTLGTVVFLNRDVDLVPPALIATLADGAPLPSRVVVVSVEVTHEARVLPGQRSKVEDLGDGLYWVTLWYGFFERPDVEGMLQQLGLNRDEPNYIVGVEYVVANATGPAQLLWTVFAVLHRAARPAALHFQLPMDRVREHHFSVVIE